MIKPAQTKKMAIGILISISAISLTACGSTTPEAKSAKVQSGVSNKWLPAKSTECQVFVTTLQNFNTVLSERMAATNNDQAAKAVNDYKSFVSDATTALNQEIAVTKSVAIKDYSKRFLDFITNLNDQKNTSNDHAKQLLTQIQDLTFNPPSDCLNK